ncbi:MAG TPA: hypothetical protein VND92_00780 [Vicinamibacterales bacterium]|nr:hypothetical protein [Vicinamibacterales bacterium]
MRIAHLLLRTVVIGAAAAGLAAQAPAAKAPDVHTLGPQVGQTVPAFQLLDDRGRPHTLASAAGPKGTMLVFFRSADW